MAGVSKEKSNDERLIEFFISFEYKEWLNIFLPFELLLCVRGGGGGGVADDAAVVVA